MCIRWQSATRVAHLCCLQSCHLKGSLWLFLFLPSFTLFRKCCLSHWESAGNEWLPLSASGVSIWGNGTTHKGRLGSGREPLVSLNVGLWETDPRAASAWLMSGSNQVSPLFGHVITPGILTALLSVLKYQAGLWSYFKDEVSHPLLCYCVLAQGIRYTQQNSFKSKWDVAQQGFELISVKASLFLTLPTLFTLGDASHTCDHHWATEKGWSDWKINLERRSQANLSSGSSLNSLLGC